MKETTQIVVISNSEDCVNKYLRTGWVIKSITAGTVCDGAIDKHSKYCFLLEYTKEETKTEE